MSDSDVVVKQVSSEEENATLNGVKRARTLLLIYHPFFGYLATKLRVRVTRSVQSLATDERSLFVNPDFWRKLRPNQQITAVTHEVMHCACHHCSRRYGRLQSRWNVAGDHAINNLLKGCGFEPIVIPGEFEWCCDENFKGMTAEHIYDLLPEGKCGSGCKGVMDASSPTDQDDQAPNWERIVVEAAKFAKDRGNLPQEIQEWVDEIVRPKVDWRRFIRSEIITTCKRNDWTYRRQNRRYAHQGIILPTQFGYTTEAVVWLDSSGSIDSELWSLFLGGVLEIAVDLGVRLSVGVCDADVRAYYENVRSISDVKSIEFRGRGGTDFGPAFEYEMKRKVRPSVMFYFTDLCGSFPDRKPLWSTVWAVPEGSADPESVKVPFGKVVFIRKENNR